MLRPFTWAFALVLLSTSAPAALHGRLPITTGGTDYQAYYDDVLDITWLANANLADTESFGVPGVDANGSMASWDTAQTWIAAMNDASYLGVANWRVPSTIDSGTPGCDVAFSGTDCGWNVNIATGEMARVYYSTLGNVAIVDPSGLPTSCNYQPPSYCLTNSGPFANLQPRSYWSTADAFDNSSAWSFHFDDGRQAPAHKTEDASLVWPVRYGDIMPNPPGFTPLGDLPGGDFSSIASDISADGRTVVGQSKIGPGIFDRETFRWRTSTGMVGLGDLPGGNVESLAAGVSADGRTVAGSGSSAVYPRYEAFRWTKDGGMTGLGVLPGGILSRSHGISDDGGTVVGDSRNEAFRWTASAGMVGLGDLPGGDSYSEASNVSADGSVVIGLGHTNSGTEAFRWTAGTGLVGLGELPGGLYTSIPYDVTADGSVIVGYGYSANGREAFRWTASTGMVGLGDLAGGSVFSHAYAVSADGSTVVGRSMSANGYEAFVWTQSIGMQRLVDMLATDEVNIPAGWLLLDARGISADGKWVVGYGTNPDGNTEAFLVELELNLDSDNDGRAIKVDNCPSIANPDQADTDRDLRGNLCDNCRLLANNVAIGAQADSDNDGFGNRCDGDMNNNGMTNAQDTTLYRQQIGYPSAAPTYNKADIDANGVVNAQDTTLFRQLIGSPPGPGAGP